MVVCRRSPNGNGGARRPDLETPGARAEARRKDGGPVFLPRRRPSAIAESLLAAAADGGQVTAYDDAWFAGRPSTQ